MRTRLPRKPSLWRSGFSLIELLTAMAIGTIVLVAAAAILAASNRSSASMHDALSATREQCEVLRQLSEDLSCAIPHPLNRFAAEGSSVASNSNTDDLLAFLCLKPAAAQPVESRFADLCAVRYSLKDLPSASGNIRCLVRQLIPSRETFSALRSGESVFSPNQSTQTAEPVAIGVLHLSIDLLEPSSDGFWSTMTTELSLSQTIPDPRRAIRLRLVLATPSLRARLTHPEDWNSLANVAATPATAWPTKWRSQLVPLELILPIGPSA